MPLHVILNDTYVFACLRAYLTSVILTYTPSRSVDKF